MLFVLCWVWLYLSIKYSNERIDVKYNINKDLVLSKKVKTD